MQWEWPRRSLPSMPFLVVAAALALPVSDSSSNCAHWSDIGECEKNPSFMSSACAKSCATQNLDQLPHAECAKLVLEGGCSTSGGLAQCRSACYTFARSNHTVDTDGNCWYWSTDGECSSNAAWMQQSCGRSCAILRACSADASTAACARTFECPLPKDLLDEGCADRALAGE